MRVLTFAVFEVRGIDFDLKVDFDGLFGCLLSRNSGGNGGGGSGGDGGGRGCGGRGGRGGRAGSTVSSGDLASGDGDVTSGDGDVFRSFEGKNQGGGRQMGPIGIRICT